jgi:hypothetical protein
MEEHFWRSIKQTDSRKAIEIARKWEKAARLAANLELTQATSLRLLDELMEITIGENLIMQSIDSFCGEWRETKKSTGTTRGTVKRYKLLVRRKTNYATLSQLANARKFDREN